MPNPITLNLAQQVRAAGTYTLGPQLLPAGYSLAEIVFNLATADYEAANNVNQVTSTIWQSPDNGQSWDIACQSFWQSNGQRVSHTGVIDPPPTLSCGVAPYQGRLMKLTITLNRQMTIGMTGTLS